MTFFQLILTLVVIFICEILVDIFMEKLRR